MNIDKTKTLKTLILQCKALRDSIERSLNDKGSEETGRYASYRLYASKYNVIATKVYSALEVEETQRTGFDVKKMLGWGDTLWPYQRQIMESVLLETNMLLSLLESETEFSEDEFDKLENFFRAKLRASVFDTPSKEFEIQNVMESLFIGKGWTKGIDFDRETGKVKFSGKEYVPDFIIPKLDLCIEVKLLREGKKSNIIEQINSDINGYSKSYERQMFVIYDLGTIQNEEEFRRDIENTGESIRVVIIKH